MGEPGTRLRTARPKTEKELASEYPISVVIPVRSVGPNFAKCIQALQRNELDNIQLVVVDDGSDRGVEQWAESQLNGISAAVVRLPVSLGPAGARNAGLEHSQHPYILFLDSDVELPDRSIGWIRESFDVYSHRKEVVGVLGSYSEVIPWDDFFSNFKNLYTCHLYNSTDALSPFIHTPIFCVHKETLIQNGGFDDSFATAEDFRLGVVLGSQGYRFAIDRRVTGVHLKRYGLHSILKEDRRRIRDLRRVALNDAERQFSYSAHRWSRLLNFLLPGPILALLVASLWAPALLVSAAVLLLVFICSAWGFLKLCRKRRGQLFSTKAAAFLFFEMLWAEIVAGLAFISGKDD
jgi:glycosyltransferase involved in cell wall biosynthesis